MVVQHNLQAHNASRMLGITSSAQAKSTEKLSSGFRINRAADDAAGLSISEKMRKQIRGLDQASTNAQDGVSAVQTAEGALTEVHSMLQRMNELAVQAANGTNSETDRQSIQDEIEQLTTEIDRVAETTKFNETYLLKGNADGTKVTKAVNAHDAGLNGNLVDKGNGVTKFSLKEKLKDGDSVSIGGAEYKIGSGKTEDSYKLASKLGSTVANVGDSVTISGKEYTLTNNVKISTLTNTGTGDNQYTASLGDQIIAKDGTVYEYYVKADGTNTIANGKANTTTVTTGWYKKDEFQDTASFEAGGNMKTLGSIAKEGATLKLKTAQDKNGLDTFNITRNLNDGDVSAWKLGSNASGDANKGKIDMDNLKGAALGDSSKTISAGDSITTKGETLTAVDTDFTPTKLSDVAKEIGALEANSQVTISNIDGSNSTTYKVAQNSATEDEGQSPQVLTREHIVQLLEEGQQVTLKDKDGNDITGKTFTVAGVDAGDEDKISAQRAYTLMAEELQKASSIGADTEAKVTNNNDGTFDIKQGTVTYADKLSFNLHVGADADMTNKINVDVHSMSAASLGIKGINLKDDTGNAATYAIDAIADAVAKVSQQRSALGAVQNRLEHTIANVDNVVENSTAAESRIRDTDMAEEMVNYSKNNILAQAGQSMLAQANQSTQGVLSILG
ncbi:flagellin [Pseudobutyrivibrio sp. ACV-2]|nr:flagellin [Pseudobutyrivibrio sp. ACV-2]SEA16900.1 flagellin [Pseudobutyrivibrio sp. ACV-2]